MIQQLENVRDEFETGRAYVTGNSTGVEGLVPPPLSPPLIDQALYYPTGLIANENRRSAI
uniref:Uncharacterized protein n=1 Tax=Heterorhabditis bacteriophora TaxID=37862 RepID=A0A1I7X9G8_HETBA